MLSQILKLTFGLKKILFIEGFSGANEEQLNVI